MQENGAAVPVENGLPAAGVAVLAPMRYEATPGLPKDPPPTTSTDPLGSRERQLPWKPAGSAIGLKGSEVSAPVVWFTDHALTVLLTLFSAYSRPTAMS